MSFEVVGDSDASGGICGDDTFCSDTINLVGDELVLGSEEEATTAFRQLKMRATTMLALGICRKTWDSMF